MRSKLVGILELKKLLYLGLSDFYGYNTLKPHAGIK